MQKQNHRICRTVFDAAFLAAACAGGSKRKRGHDQGMYPADPVFLYGYTADEYTVSCISGRHNQCRG